MSIGLSFVVLTLLPGAEPAKSWQLDSAIRALTVSPTGDGFAVVTPTQTIFQPFDGKAVKLAAASNVPKHGACIAFDRSGDKLAFVYGTSVFVMSPAGKEIQTIERVVGKQTAFAGGGKAILHHLNGRLNLTRLSDRKLLRSFTVGPPDENDQRPIRFSASSDGRYLAILENSGTVRVHEISTAKEIWRAGEFERGDACTLAFADHGRSLAAWRLANPDRVVLWETATGRERAQLRLPKEDFNALTLSPDGQTIAAALPGKIRFFTLATGKETDHLSTESKRIRAVAFTPEGRRLVVGDEEGCVRMHEVPAVKPTAAELSDERLKQLWKALQPLDGEAAFRAQVILSDHPKESVPYLKARLAEELKASDEEVIQQLIAQLDDDDFKEREQAADRLRQLGALAEPHLKKAIGKEMPSLELRRRVEKLLDGIDRATTSQSTRSFGRAIEVLENIGSAEARAVMADLVKQGEDASWALDVERALDRIELRKKAK